MFATPRLPAVMATLAPGAMRPRNDCKTRRTSAAI
jgi:hypothetical protein